MAVGCVIFLVVEESTTTVDGSMYIRIIKYLNYGNHKMHTYLVKYHFLNAN